MIRRIAITAAFAALAAAGQANAANADLSSLTCGELKSIAMQNQQSAGFILIWGMGNTEATAGRTAFDFDRLQVRLANVGALCDAEPQSLVRDVMARVAQSS